MEALQIKLGKLYHEFSCEKYEHHILKDKCNELQNNFLTIRYSLLYFQWTCYGINSCKYILTDDIVRQIVVEEEHTGTAKDILDIVDRQSTIRYPFQFSSLL